MTQLISRLVEMGREKARQWRDEILTTGREGIITALNTAVGIITARLLLPEGKGQLTAVLLWPNFVKSLGNFGLDHAIVYYTGQRIEDVESVAGSAFLIGSIQGVLAALAGYLLIPFFLSDYGSEVVGLTQLLFLFVPVMYASGYSMRVLHGMRAYDTWNSIQVLGKAVYAGGVFCLWGLNVVSVRLVVYAYILSTVIAALVSIGFLARKIHRPRLDWSLVRSMLRYGGKNYLTSLTGQANARLDQALISAFLPPSQLGLYKVAVSASQSIRLLGSGFRGVIISEVSNTKETRTARKRILKTLKASGGTLALAALLLIGALPYLIPFLFGVEYEGAVLAAQILLVGSVAFGVKQTLFNGVRGEGYPEIPFYAEVVGTLVTGIGLYFLLQLLGIEGAAITSLIAYVTSLVVASAFLWKQWNRPKKASTDSS